MEKIEISTELAWRIRKLLALFTNESAGLLIAGEAADAHNELEHEMIKQLKIGRRPL